MALCCLFLLYGFGVFAFPYIFAVDTIMQKLGLPTGSYAIYAWPWLVSPAIWGMVRIDYVGFALPALLGTIMSIQIYRKFAPNPGNLTKDSKILLALVPSAVAISHFAPLWTIFAGWRSGGEDPVILASAILFLYHMTSQGRIKQGLMMAYPLGFLVGFVSDLESRRYVQSPPIIFGGYGLVDADFIIPLAFVVAVTLLGATERRVISVFG